MIFQTFQKSIMKPYSTFSFKKSLLSTRNTFVFSYSDSSDSESDSSDSEKTNLFILERFALLKKRIQNFLDQNKNSEIQIINLRYENELEPLLINILNELKNLYLMKGSNCPAKEFYEIWENGYKFRIYRSEFPKTHRIRVSRKKFEIIVIISKYNFNIYRQLCWRGWNRRKPKNKAKFLIFKIIEFRCVYKAYDSKTGIPKNMRLDPLLYRPFLQEIMKVL
jgi:hypothetical protein